MRTTAVVLASMALCLVAWAAQDVAVTPHSAAGIETDAITIPHMLNYQGRLTDNAGNAVPDSDYSVTFRMYDVPTGGTELWAETQTVATKNGLFSVLLGSVTPVGAVPDAGMLYLGMEVGGSELTPRMQIVSAAYAYKADMAQVAEVARPVGPAAGDLAGAYPDPSIAQKGASSGQVLKWTGSAWAPGPDNAGGPPSGPAGGDLTGAYPNPTIAVPCSLALVSTSPVMTVSADSGHGVEVNDCYTSTAFISSDTSWNGYWTEDSRQAGYVSLYSQGWGFITQYSGSNGFYTSSSGSHGFYNANSAGDGLYTSGSDRHGVNVSSADSNALEVHTAGGNGLHVGYSTDNAIQIDSCNPSQTTVWVQQSGYNGYAVGPCGYDGLWVTNAGHNGVGVYESDNIGVYGNSDGGKGGYFQNDNNTYYALTAYNNTGTGASVKGLYVRGGATATGGWATYLGDGANGYSLTSPDMEVITSGSGRLANGQSSVAIESDFSAAVSDEVPLKVIVTPTSACNGVFVADKNASGFTVQELAAGKSEATFDWIAIGRIKGYEQRPVISTDQPVAVDAEPVGDGAHNPNVQAKPYVRPAVQEETITPTSR